MSWSVQISYGLEASKTLQLLPELGSFITATAMISIPNELQDKIFEDLQGNQTELSVKTLPSM